MYDCILLKCLFELQVDVAISCTFYIVSLNVRCKFAVICSHKFIITAQARDVVFYSFLSVSNVWCSVKVALA